MNVRLEDIAQHRLAKLEKLRSLGIDPYPPRYYRSHTSAEAIALFEHIEADGQVEEKPTLALAGRIMTSRIMGKASFAHIMDGSGKIQIYVRADKLGPEKYELFKDLDLGDLLGVKGHLFRTRTGEITLEVDDFTLLSKSLRPLPEKWHGLTDVEKRYRQRYLDLISNEEVRRIFRTRAKVIAAIRCFLDERGFIEVETPVLQPTAGGALARPFKTYYNALDREFYLRIALELYLKRLVIGGFDKVYEIGRIFRNEGISTKHNPEFTMLETYQAYADYNDVMQMVEEMAVFVAQKALGTDVIEHDGEAIKLTPPWPRIPLRQAIFDACGVDFEDYPDAESLRAKMMEMHIPVDEKMGRGKLVDHLLTLFVEPKLIQPTFLIDYPVELSPLAKRTPDNPGLVERFEGFMGGIEIANAFTELNDPLDQRERFEEQIRERAAGDEEAELPDEDFLVALEHGMPPTGGLGVGIDRLVMVLTNQQSIREVILFPQLRTK